MGAAEKPAGGQVRQNELKWGKKLMKAGYTVLPNVLLDYQKKLGLDAVDVNIILHLACRWWHVDNPPWPSKQRIADAMGIHPRTVQRRIARLEEDKLLRRETHFGDDGRQMSNRYHLTQLIVAADKFADEEIEAREKAKEEGRTRRGRRKPHLTAVPK